MTYAEKLKDPRWQRRRLEILNKRDWACQSCFDTKSTLHVHHLWYRGDPWDAVDAQLAVLCESCHEQEHEERKGIEEDLLKILRVEGYLVNEIHALCEFALAANSSNLPRHVFIESIKELVDEPGFADEVLKMVSNKGGEHGVTAG